MLHQLVPLLALALNAVLAGAALAGARRGRREYAFAALAGAFAVWNFGVFGLRASTVAESALGWERFLHVGVIAMPLLFYLYILAFLGITWRRPEVVAGGALAAAFMLANPSVWFMAGVVRGHWGFEPDPGPLYAVFFVYVQAYVVAGVALLAVAARRMTSAFHRRRARLVALGAGVGIAGGLTDFAAHILGWDRLYPLGIPANAFFALALGLAIVRYGMLDVRAMAKWLVVHVLSAAGLGALIAGGLSGVDVLAGGDRVGAHLPSLLVAVGAIAAGLPLIRWLEGSLARVVFSRERSVRDALLSLSRELVSVLDEERLGPMLTGGLVDRVPVLQASLHVRAANDEFQTCATSVAAPPPDTAPHPVRIDPLVGMYLRLTGRPLALDELAAPGVADARLAAGLADLLAAGAAMVLPLFVDGELTGVLVVGGKVTGEVFHPAEVELLEMLAGQAAVALKNSRLYSDLRAQMDELTRTQQQLVQAAKLAAIGELAAGVAHEINNPLTTILGNCELALRGVSEGSEAHRRLRMLQEEGRRAARITRALLDFARRREPARQPVEVARLVTRTVDLLTTRVGRKRIAIETQLDPRTPPILGDADQLTQVLLNLAGNAMDAMPGGGALMIRTEWHPSLDVVTIALADTGIGMSAEQRARIFEPFFTTKPEGQGTGLGLSLSLGIVKGHGGNLTVESEPGQGTTMTVTLPAQSVSAPAAERIIPAG